MRKNTKLQEQVNKLTGVVEMLVQAVNANSTTLTVIIDYLNDDDAEELGLTIVSVEILDDTVFDYAP